MGSPVSDYAASPPSSATSWPDFMAAAAQQDYLDAESGLTRALQQGYSHWYVDGSLHGERPEDFPRERTDALLELMQQTGMRPIYHGNFKSPLGSDVPALATAALHYACREVDVCSRLGGAPLIVHGGGVVEPRLVAEVRQAGLHQLITNLRALVAYAAPRGVQVWLENLCNYTRFHPFYYICTTADEIATVLEQVPGVHLFLDVSHAYVNGGDPVAMFRQFHNRIIGMSFSDNHQDRDAHLPLGAGSLPFDALVAAIIEAGWRGMVGFETRGGTLAGSVQQLSGLAALRGNRGDAG
jgi:L-ribulose-5-phosphate 3-epimerase